MNVDDRKWRCQICPWTGPNIDAALDHEHDRHDGVQTCWTLRRVRLERDPVPDSSDPSGAGPEYAYPTPFADWRDFVDRVARPILDTPDDMPEVRQAAVDLFDRTDPAFILACFVFMADRLDERR